MATILIVDDLAANRDLLVTLLRYGGHRMLEAADGAAALEVARTEQPDLIIADVLMPVMDGYEFVRHLRGDPATHHLPVIFCTAHYGAREARELALSSGVAHVLVKPIDPQEVLDVVQAVLALQLSSSVGAPSLAPDFDREHLRLVTDKLSETTEDLRLANARLRALIEIGLELAAERDPERLLESVCASAQELFGATYVTLGILDRDVKIVSRVVACGVDAGDWMGLGRAPSGVFQDVIEKRSAARGEDPASTRLPVGHPPVKAYLIVPVASPSHVYGWLHLVGNEGRTFGADDEQMAVALAGQVGRIYENGYFYGIAQRRADQLESEVVHRKRSERALRRERDHAQRYLDTAAVIFLALDPLGRITLINRYACALLGWTADELLGRDWVENCLPPRDHATLRGAFKRLLKGDTSPVVNRVLAKSGQERTIEWRNTLVTDAAGIVTGTFSCGTDITEREEALEALRVAEERMRFALATANVGIWDMDYVTGQLRWSETLEAHYGVPAGTFPGTFEAFVACIHPDDRESALAAVGEAMKDGRDFWVQNRALWPDGTVRWLNGAGRILLGGDGSPIRGVGISLDVTERRTLEAQYQQAQKMEAVGRLAGGIAHDFNNLLTAILGYCELLQSDMSDSDPRRADVGQIRKAGTTAASLTRQLLAFSRKGIIEPKLIDLNSVLNDLQTMLQRLIGEDINVVMSLQSGQARVLADRGQMEQVVLNLAVNARDAMPGGGTLTIETRAVELDEGYQKSHLAAKPGQYVGLTVSDTGTGMSPEVQARLFEPFFTTKEAGKGTGLGLATVHGIVTGVGGLLNVYSEVGQGTSFSVYFPCADPQQIPAEPVVPSPKAASGHQTILVVDDADGPRELAQRFLARRGYAVLVATDSREALRLLESHSDVDLVLTDVVMPGGSGPQLIHEVTAFRPSIKVIYMSGYTDEAIVQHGVLNPGVAFLHKPFSSASLEQKVREVLG